MIGSVLAAPDLPDVARGLPSLAWWSASLLAIAATLDYLVAGNRMARTAEDTPKMES
jgi:hypothetical protein